MEQWAGLDLTESVYDIINISLKLLQFV